MKRLFTTLMVSMFAFGFCVSLSGCGDMEEAAPADTSGSEEAAAGGDAGSTTEGGGDAKGSAGK